MAEETSEVEPAADGSQDLSPSIMASPPSKPTLLSLPAEIRTMIYKMVYSSSTILLTCKRGDISTWLTPTGELIAPKPFHDLHWLNSNRNMRASINISLGLLTACRTTYHESIELVAPLTELHVDHDTVDAVWGNRYMPSTWMERVHHLNLSASLENTELLRIKSWYTNLAVLEMHDLSAQDAVSIPRSRLLDLSQNDLLSLFSGNCGEVEDCILHGYWEVSDGDCGVPGVDVFDCLTRTDPVELWFSRLIVSPQRGPTICYKVSINSKEMIVKFDHYSPPKEPYEYMSKDEFDRGGYGIPASQVKL